MTGSGQDWKQHGVCIVRAGELDFKTPQTPGRHHAAITHASAGAIIIRSGPDPVVVNLGIPARRSLIDVRWIDPTNVNSRYHNDALTKMGRAPILLLLSSAVISAQPKSNNRLVDIHKPSQPPAAVKGMPYSGDLLSELIVVFDDGTRFKQAFVDRTEYRDAQGRTRREQSIPPDEKESLRIVTIDDPAAGIEYVLEPSKKIAHRFKLTEPATPPLSLGPAEAASTGAPGIVTKTEPLEPRVIQGMRAEGARVTETLPDMPGPGGHNGWFRVTETWTATDLQAVVLERVSMDGSEKNTRINKLRREEQPGSLFEVPADYRVEDELQDFIIQYPIRGRTSLPQVISRVPAKYTQRAGSLGIAGTVLLTATIEESGRARDVHVERSLDPELDEEAIKAVSQWRFRPAQEDGHPVSMDVKVEVTFGLN